MLELILGIVIFALHILNFVTLIVKNPFLTIAAFGLLYFIVLPLFGIFLSGYYVYKGAKFHVSALKTTAFFFVVLLASYIAHLALSFAFQINTRITPVQMIFNLAKSLALFTATAFVGSMIVSFIASKLVGNKEKV